MKNEEKAKEIKANDVCCVWNGGCPNVYSAAIEMVEWKDQCFQVVIDGIKESYQLDSSAIFICNLIEQRYKNKFK